MMMIYKFSNKMSRVTWNKKIVYTNTFRYNEIIIFFIFVGIVSIIFNIANCQGDFIYK